MNSIFRPGSKKIWVLVAVCGLVVFGAAVGLQENRQSIIHVEDIDHSTVTINNQPQYGIPPEKLIEVSKKLGIAENERDAWMQKYKELESQLASRTDDVAKQAKAFLEAGKLEDAEKLFKQSLASKLNIVKEAAAEAFALAQIKVLQLNYPEAKNYYQQAVQLDPENALYLNASGVHLYTMGEYSQAEPLYKRSLAIWENALGKSHPNVATSLNNLAELYRTQGRYTGKPNRCTSAAWLFWKKRWVMNIPLPKL